jgi:4-oxalocrotonate tautomerase
LKKAPAMPLVRIDLNENSSTKLRKTISEVVYSAMTEVANVPEHDKFQIFLFPATVTSALF